MTDQTYTVQVQRDFLERQAAARPIQALAELDGNLYAYDMEIIEDSIQKFRVSDQKEIARDTTGVEVTISELHGEYPSIEPDSALRELTEIFALYLKDYRDVSIRLKGEKLDPAAAIQTHPGGTHFDQIVDDDSTVLVCMHNWNEMDAQHEDAWPQRVAGESQQHGFLLWFVVEDFEAAWERAKRLGAAIDEEPRVGVGDAGLNARFWPAPALHSSGAG